MVENVWTEKQLFQRLKDNFADYQRRGFVRLTTNSNYNDHNCCFLPSHVVNNSIHTKVSNVSDASCKQKLLELSLNDFLSKGSNWTNSLVEKLLRCWLNRVSLTAAIEEAFLPVKIKDEDRRYLRFYHQHNPEKKSMEPDNLLSTSSTLTVFDAAHLLSSSQLFHIAIYRNTTWSTQHRTLEGTYLCTTSSSSSFCYN